MAESIEDCNKRCYELIKDISPYSCQEFELQTTDFLLHLVILYNKQYRIEILPAIFKNLVEAGYPISLMVLDCIFVSDWKQVIEFLKEKSLIPANYIPVKWISIDTFICHLQSLDTKSQICQKISDYKYIHEINLALAMNDEKRTWITNGPFIYALTSYLPDLILESFINCKWIYDYHNKYNNHKYLDKMTFMYGRYKIFEKLIIGYPSRYRMYNMEDLCEYTRHVKRYVFPKDRLYLAACLYHVSRISEFSFMQNTKASLYVKRYKLYLACIFHAVIQKSDLPPVPKDVILYMAEFL